MNKKEKNRKDRRGRACLKQAAARCLAWFLVLCIAGLIPAVPTAYASDPALTWDPDQTVTMEIQLSENNRDRSEVIFWIYKIARALPVAPTSGSISVELTENFAQTNVPLVAANTSELLRQIRTLRQLIRAENIAPDYTVETDADGYCMLSGLEQGVYLIIPDNTDPYYGVIATSMIVLPRTDENGSWIYTEHMSPKYTDEDDEYFEHGDENDTMAASNEETSQENTSKEESTEESSASESEQESLPWESVPEESEQEASVPEESFDDEGSESTAAMPSVPSSSTEPPTQATTSVVRTSSSEQQILGVEDFSGYLGMLLLGTGVVLFGLTMILMWLRRMGSRK